jgi:PAS domain S-box-containing protein
MTNGEIRAAEQVFIKSTDSLITASQSLVSGNIDGVKVLDQKGAIIGLIHKDQIIRAIAEGLSPDTEIAQLMSDCVENLDFFNEMQTKLEMYKQDALAGKTDITDHEQLICSLYQLWRREKEELESFLDCIYNPIISVDRNGNVDVYNKSVEKMTGVPASEARGNSIGNLFHSDLPRILKTGKTEPTQKYYLHNKTYLSNRTPIFKNGQITGAIAVLQDISELEGIVEELVYTQELNRELDAIFESSFDGLYITDGEANTLRLNKGFERITGIMESECKGRNMADLVKKGVFSASGTLLALEKRERVTITLVARTGKEVLVTSNPIFDEEGNIIRVVTNVRDITELNYLQEKLEHVEGLSRVYQAELEELKIRTQCIIHSAKMRELINLALRVAAVDSTVLIEGESGVGKELVATTIHANSSRKDHPFIKVNCGAIPENLLESELFGYEPGAFTGASKSGKAGMFELANEGILFLDEIGDLPLNLQVKLLRVIQDKYISRVGSTRPILVDVRIIAATNHNLAEMVNKQLFRKDLYYRLNVVPIQVPPLRERREDIPALSKHFMEKFNRRHNMNKRLSNRILGYFMSYDWPGNIRELENLIERLVVTTLHDTIDINDLSFWAEFSSKIPDIKQGLVPLQKTLENTERRILQDAFSLYASTYEIARVLGISQPTVVRKAAKYGITRSQ